MTLKRSSKVRIDQTGAHAIRVGARHSHSAQPHGGVGYLDVCTNLESPIQKKNAADPRIHQLKKMGLDWRWITIAERIGFDAFLTTWTLLSDMFDDDRSYVRASIPHVKKLIRYQRDMMIRKLHADGVGIRNIETAVFKIYGFLMAHRTIRDVINTTK